MKKEGEKNKDGKIKENACFEIWIEIFLSTNSCICRDGIIQGENNST